MGPRDEAELAEPGRRESAVQNPPNPPDQPRLTTRLTILYALTCGFTSANLSYSQPILAVLARDFHVSQSRIANVPALAQAGNALGLLAILPLADFFPRRHFTLILMAVMILFW